MRMTATWAASLAALVGCGSQTQAAEGEYEIVAPAFCDIDEVGEPRDVIAITGTVRVLEPTSIDGRPPECDLLVWVQADLCDGCAPTSSQLCARTPVEGSWTLGPGYVDSLDLPSVQFTDWRGGLAYDLFVSAQQVTGTFGPEGDAPLVVINGSGTIQTGRGPERPATIHCEINTTRAP
ncbi:MAG: hypothetical protein K1X94_16955 [Sandaracinaceae bacterium]|nr:hypothetical protein [Sandaracinaceae bacterium]